MEWKSIESNEHGDWISQRSDGFGNYIGLNPIKQKENKSDSFFLINSPCFQTNRDAWVYNSSKKNVSSNMEKMINFYNNQVKDYQEAKAKDLSITSEAFLNNDPTKISWSSSLIPHLEKGNLVKFEKDKIIIGQYRPFFKQRLYVGEKMIHRRGQFQEILPNLDFKNLVICVSGIGSSKDFSALMTDCVPDLQMLMNGQALPLYYYEAVKTEQTNLFQGNDEKFVKRDGISDFILKQARAAYSNVVTKEDIFYYVYGFLHCPAYREAYAADLKKMLPRIPLVSESVDFWSFAKAGRKLAKLHLDYETVKPADGVVVSGAERGDFRVEKMRFESKENKTVIHYNSKITISNIPMVAYEYVVNGKSAIEWILERYQVSVHKDSGIKNDPNDWSLEVGKERYILDLLLSVIRVSVESVEIVGGLPKVSFL